MFSQPFHALRTVSRITFCHRSAVLVYDLCDRKVIGRSCSTVPLKSHWCAFDKVQRYTHTRSSRSPQTRTQRTSHTSLWLTGCTTPMCNNLHTLVGRQEFSAQVHHSDVSGQHSTLHRRRRWREEEAPRTRTHTHTDRQLMVARGGSGRLAGWLAGWAGKGGEWRIE